MNSERQAVHAREERRPRVPQGHAVPLDSPGGAPTGALAHTHVMLIRVMLMTMLALSTACAGRLASSRAGVGGDPAVATLGERFVSRTLDVNGTTLHCVRGGTGPEVILLHGFPQDWYAFHEVMPRLAGSFTVTAVDLRGIGGSKATPGGYDSANLATDIQQLALRLQAERPYIVGHHIGGMVAYAFARLYPGQTRGVMILDVPLPGVEPWEEVKAEPALWHAPFHQTSDLPEQLLVGRQTVYFRHFFRHYTVGGDAIGDEDLAHYARLRGTRSAARHARDVPRLPR
jgi:pimeloyl-ACP methyl ester carboxylesterase